MKRTSFRFDRSLINHKGDSVRYLEVGMEAPTPGTDSKPERAPLDLALVIDRSGSMSGALLAAAPHPAPAAGAAADTGAGARELLDLVCSAGPRGTAGTSRGRPLSHNTASHRQCLAMLF